MSDSTPPENLAEIRQILKREFDDPELDALCLDHFSDVYDKFSRGMRKDEKITLLLDFGRRLPIRFDKLLRLVGKPPEDETFHLPFANREAEKELIQKLLGTELYVQIYAPSGLGKTYMLREMERALQFRGWQTVWLDFAVSHRDLRADQYRFLQEVSQQALGFPLSDFDEENALKRIGREVADLDQLVLFLDNADWAATWLLRWIRESFLQTLTTDWVPIRVLASGQQLIPEWQGYAAEGRFYGLSLSELNDSVVIAEIMNDIVARFGAKPVRKRQATANAAWQAQIGQMVAGVLQISPGHPLVMAELLRIAAEQDGFMHASFFIDNQAELCLRYLRAIVDGHILLTVDSTIREAFRSLCIFRYLWPMLILSLTKTQHGLGAPWEPFSSRRKRWHNWWSMLEDMHLVHKAGIRQLHPISPIIRQVIALVLQAENAERYQTRHRRARQEYEQLRGSEAQSVFQRAAGLLEVFYHATQDGTLSPASAASLFAKKLKDFLLDLASNDSLVVARQLKEWLREDSELQETINQFAGVPVTSQLIEQIDHFVKGRKEEKHE
jgi:hypothetical protein